MTDDVLLSVNGLKTQFKTEQGLVKAVDDVTFDIGRNEVVGLVGESGAGKSVTARSIIGLVDRPGEIAAGSIVFDDQELTSLDKPAMRSLRGYRLSMIFQDPMTSLNPAFTVGTQIVDVIMEHMELDKEAAKQRALTLLDDVGVPEPAERFDEYPHNLSGGLRQRVLIAMAISCDPDLLIADEPTTALDVTIQAQIIELLRDLQEKYGLSMLLITHNISLVSELCDKLIVMYAGRIVENGPVGEVINHPRHPYTVGLMNSIPRINDHRERLDTISGQMPDLIETPSGCSFRDRCPHAVDACAEREPPLEAVNGRSHTSACIRIDEIDFEDELSTPTASSGEARNGHSTNKDVLLEANDLKKFFASESQGWLERVFGEQEFVHAVDDVTLDIYQGETLGLVGESGCGKSTLGKTIVRLIEPDDGTVVFAGTDLTTIDSRGLRESRKDLQVIFQDPFASLNPRKTAKSIIGRPLQIHNGYTDDDELEARVVELLHEVGLDESQLYRYPHEFSGGQRQRIGIARALAVDPDFIVADEPVSALDVGVQAKILNLLMDLKTEKDLTFLFITHDLNVVQHIADRVAVMYLGKIVEIGTVEEIFRPPYHPYTELLLSSIPSLDPDSHTSSSEFGGVMPSPLNPPSGCRFHTRCPYAIDECTHVEPRDVAISDSHAINCHLFDHQITDSYDDPMEPDQSEILSD